MADDNNNNAQQQQQQQQQQQLPPLLQIQDIDDWLRFNGLRAADDPSAAPAEYGSFLSDLNRSEAHAKQEAQEQYQQQIHASIFKEAMEAEEEQQSMKEKLLAAWEGEMMMVVSDDKTFVVSLTALAALCDTVFTMASSRRYMGGNNSSTNSNSDDTKEDALDPVQLSLVDYPASSVHHFLELAIGELSMANIQDEFVVDCCHIAHYLQCQKILDGTNEILLRHVDSDNCLSLCQMADQLDLPDLFERSLFHMLKSLDDLESQEAYEVFSPELKERICGIRAVFTKYRNTKLEDDKNKERQQQSTHSDGTTPPTPKRHFYFTSLDEYIAIFAENVQYHRERLEEAKEQNMVDFSAYAQGKIEKQETRVLTLEAMLQEQKRLFGSKHRRQGIQKRVRL